MFAWLQGLLRAHELPNQPATPVRVDFVGRVVSHNAATSPITQFTAAILEIVLMDRVVIAGQRNMPDREVFGALGGMRFGPPPLVIEDDAGRTLVIDNLLPCRIIPLSERPLELDTPVPAELLSVAARCAETRTLCYREVRFREQDRVRVVATVRSEPRATDGGYRGRTTHVMVPVDGDRLELREML